MENNLEIFKNEQFGEIRTVTIDNEPWFAAVDACNILDIKNTTDAVKRLDNDEVTRLNLGGLSGETNIINEYGLYSLILGSRKKEAKAFKRWITHDVIPAIRKTGTYQLPQISKELQAIFKLDGMHQELKEELKEEVKQLKDDMPLFNIDCKELTSLVGKTGVLLLGGKQSVAYKDKSTRTMVYCDIYKQLKREFGVERYESIKRADINNAKNVIYGYKLPQVLKVTIENMNNGVN